MVNNTIMLQEINELYIDIFLMIKHQLNSLCHKGIYSNLYYPICTTAQGWQHYSILLIFLSADIVIFDLLPELIFLSYDSFFRCVV